MPTCMSCGQSTPCVHFPNDQRYVPPREEAPKPKATKPSRNKHQHEFTIPVEWKYESIYEYGGIDNRDLVNIPMAKKITVWRCKCGEETKR